MDKGELKKCLSKEERRNEWRREERMKEIRKERGKKEAKWSVSSEPPFAKT